MYNINTGQESPVVTDPAEQSNPAIEGNYIVWEDRRSGNLDIYMYDLSTGKTIPIVTDTSPQKDPAISNGRVVWTDGRNTGTNIFIYDIAKGQEKMVSTASQYESNPAIDGNKIVWQDKRKSSMDIYMFTEDTSNKGAVAEKTNGTEAGKQSPIGIYPAVAAIAAAYLIVTVGRNRGRKI